MYSLMIIQLWPSLSNLCPLHKGNCFEVFLLRMDSRLCLVSKTLTLHLSFVRITFLSVMIIGIPLLSQMISNLTPTSNASYSASSSTFQEKMVFWPSAWSTMMVMMCSFVPVLTDLICDLWFSMSLISNFNVFKIFSSYSYLESSNWILCLP